MGRRVTAQDVADLAGVSRSSVSVVLNGRAQGNISAAKQKTIMEAAHQLDYRPNALAMSLRSRRTLTIGVLTWRGALGFPEELLHAAGEAATEAGYLLIMMDATHDAERESRAVATLLDRQVDGFLVIAPELVEYRRLEIMAGVPTILVNAADPDGAVSSIVPDEFGAAVSAATILVEGGHVRIGLLTDGAGTLQVRNRVAGVHAALLGAGLPAPLLLPADRDINAGAARVREALRSAEPPTGLVCCHERLALGAVLAAAELQVAIPAGLSLVSLDDGERLAAGLVPALTTVQRPDQVMAEHAVRMLVADLNSGTESEVRRLTFHCPTQFHVSTGPAPGRTSAETP